MNKATTCILITILVLSILPIHALAATEETTVTTLDEILVA